MPSSSLIDLTSGMAGSVQDLPGETFAVVHQLDQAAGDVVVVPPRQREDDCGVLFETGVNDVAVPVPLVLAERWRT